MDLRPLASSELPAVLDLLQQTYAADYSPYLRPDWDRVFGGFPSGTFLGAFEDGKLMGCCGLVQSSIASYIGELMWLTIDPEHQQKQIGTALCLARIEWARSHTDWRYLISFTKPSTRYGANATWVHLPNENKALLTLSLR